jgi:diguanylate cyclase (GGDEF)-like protein/PAS domain S-box-containing protein
MDELGENDAGPPDALELYKHATSTRPVDESLRESESEVETRTKLSLDRMLDGFAILRSVREGGQIVDFEWVYLNNAAAAAWGRTVEFTLGARLRTLVPSVDESGEFDEFCQVVETGEPSSKLHREYHDDSVAGFFDSLAWKTDDGVAVTWRDVTDRERALAAIKSNEERFRASVEQLHEALSVFTAVRDDAGYIVDFRWEFANTASSDFTGFAPSELTGRSLLELLPGQETSRLLDVFRHVVESGEPYVEPSLWYEAEWGNSRHERRAFDVRAAKLDDGFVVVTRDVTEQLAQVSELARQRQELERSNTEMRALNVLADMLQSCATSEEAYSVIAQSCAALFHEFSGSISMMHPLRDVLDSRARWGDPVGSTSFAPSDCWALRRGRPYVSGAVGPRCGHLRGAPARRCLCVPMIGQSKAMGVVHIMCAVADGDESADFDDSPTRHLAVTVAGQLSMAFANLRLRDSLREMSIRDPLTGLFNRRFMEETLDRDLGLALRSDTEVGIVLIDVDHFKAFNDTYGHEAGDAVLEAVGEVLTRFSRASDVACRFGGEEFMMILPGCSIEDTRLRAEELRHRVAELRVPFRNIELSGPTISCGVAAYPKHGDSSAVLIRRADEALYAAKRGGRDQVSTAPLDDGLRQHETSGLNPSL